MSKFRRALMQEEQSSTLKYIQLYDKIGFNTNYTYKSNSTIDIMWDYIQKSNAYGVFNSVPQDGGATNGIVYAGWNYNDGVYRINSGGSIVSSRTLADKWGLTHFTNTTYQFNAENSNIYIGYTTDTNNSQQVSNFKLYYCKFYEDGELVYDLEPCLNSNGIACFHEIISDQYFYPSTIISYGEDDSSILDKVIEIHY